MELVPGHRLGPYEIVGTLGSGGMGTVYRARDTRLQRDVAIKVSSGRFGERFEREARAIGQLNHPNICTLFDVGLNYLVMELIDGETLAHRLKHGGIPPDEVLRIGQQISEALDVAHDRGVIHRDLKPGNVMVRPDGRVKVLDFGLAKMGGMVPRIANDDSPTETMEETRAGVILGTASYMSPEQAMGKPSDKRSDVYSFGAVVYEMLTGERLHRGKATTEVLASVIKDEPQWDKVPAKFRRLLRSCLAKDPQQRLRHIGDVMRLVEEGELTTDPISVASLPKAPKRKRGWLWPMVAAALVAAASAGWWFYGRAPQKLEVLRFQILEEGKFKLQNSSPSVSPDGKWVAFQAAGNDGMSHIWLRALDSLESRAIPGTETPNQLQSPAYWSYDSKTILFSDNPAPFSAGHFKRVDIAGGTPQNLAETGAGVSGAAWTMDGTILFLDSAKGYLQKVPATGGPPVPVTAMAPGDRFHMMPQFLPDGRTFLYHRVTQSASTHGIYVGSLDKAPAEQSTIPILLTDREAFYSSAGGDHLVFLRGKTLFAQSFDLSTKKLLGEPLAVVDGISSFEPAFSGRYTISTNGVLAYNAGSITNGMVMVTDRETGRVLQDLGDFTSFLSLEFSPDSKRMASSRREFARGSSNIWVTDLATGNSSKITYAPGSNESPVWSPDGQSIIFASNRNGEADIYLKKADGTGEDRLILKTGEDKYPTSWSSNGFLLFDGGTQSNLDLWVLPHPEAGNAQPIRYLKTKDNEQYARFSPDGKWVAYHSSESGMGEVYIRPFDANHPGESAASGRWLMSRDGGYLASWAKNGRELLYVANGRIAAQEVDPAKPYEVKGPPKDLGETTVGVYRISPDGTKLGRVVVPKGEIPAQLIVVKNWHAALQK